MSESIDSAFDNEIEFVWDDHNESIGEELFSWEHWAGKSAMDERMFKAAMVDLKDRLYKSVIAVNENNPFVLNKPLSQHSPVELAAIGAFSRAIGEVRKQIFGEVM